MGQVFMSCVVHPPPTPSLKGVGLLVARDCDFLSYDCQHSIHVPQHIVVPEADQAITVGFDDFGPASVGRAFGMLPAVKFDGDAQSAASEIDDEVADLALAGKLCAAKLAPTPVRTKAPFRTGPVFAQVSPEAGT